jgi:hypothetical protein
MVHVLGILLAKLVIMLVMKEKFMLILKSSISKIQMAWA